MPKKHRGSRRVPIPFLTWLGNQSARSWRQSFRTSCQLSRWSLCQRAMSSASPPCSQQQEALSASAASSVAPVAGVAAACNHSTPLTVASTESAAIHAAPKETVEKVAADGTRISKIKVALVIGYNGSRFGGLQRNPGQFAIEDVLEEAVYIDPLSTRILHLPLTLAPVIKPGASRRATIETFTKSAGQGRLELTKACMPRATSCHSRCLRHASSLTTDQQLAAPLLFSSIICGVCNHGLLYQCSLKPSSLSVHRGPCRPWRRNSFPSPSRRHCFRRASQSRQLIQRQERCVSSSLRVHSSHLHVRSCARTQASV